MAGEETLGHRSAIRWRMMRWGGAAALLMVPAIAMQFTDEVNWGPEDFVAMGGIFAVALGAYELLAKMAGNASYRVASALAILGVFLLVWVNLAVGIIGDEGNDANWMFLALPIVGIAGAVLSNFRAAGMARTLFAMAGVQALIAAIAVGMGLGTEGPIWPRDVLGVTVILCGIWLLSGAVFRHSAR
ncbi:MAG: hypothetical protein EOP60_14040 [Sphingomonadales bacterium]|nr:MAG: hypothetical protein EOP60_14040 [Sphingomonadales bacterium]